MQAWEHTSSAWLDWPGAWQPAGLDATVQAARLPLGAAANPAAATGGLGVPVGPAAMLMIPGGVQVGAGPVATPGAPPLSLRPGPVQVAMDALVQTAGGGRMILMAHYPANRYNGWRDWDAGFSVPALSVSRTSPAAVHIPVRSSLGRPDATT
ncbi:hypothetical protein G3N56_08430 [Desulfovibrio sulfodismutans]|uniref:Uncharacterized protein n=1 Tax=Desulfolutivibrio sulfodismutans TaxID=63561 RepID=A0A7K3NNJ6_9BACT|nr:hypothetical protein [Desulfolutivibrio sulfodismutans]NDY56769.1 hypothetical protein [Desulfolutivibrio sulfodismutans]QLA13313.1 hypothetical protein GD606_14100 [Desulfolutivibrio sulfodismutans DSM 3696]